MRSNRKVNRPARLPHGYRSLWAALSEADAATPSRAALAERLGVGTHTIQRILVRGDVPDFSRTVPVRVTHAWVRTITRIAYHLGHRPQLWLEQIGLQWTPEIQAISEDARARFSAGPGTVVPRPHKASDEIPVWIPREGALSPGFLEAITRRLLGAIDPSARLRFVQHESALAGVRLTGIGEGLAVAAGEPLGLHLHPLPVLALPGLRVRLAALVLRDPRSTEAASRWTELTTRESDVEAWVVDGTVGHRYLASRDVAVAQAIDPGSVGPRLIAGLLADRLERPLDRPLAFLAEAHRVASVAAILSARPGAGRDLRISTVEPDDRDDASYSIGFAFSPGWGAMLDVARDARDGDLLDRGALLTARAYAEELVAAHAAAGLVLRAAAPPRASLTLTEFRQAGPAFRAEFARALLDSLGTRLRREIPPAEAGISRATPRLVAVRCALAIVPAEWGEAVRAVAERIAQETDEPYCHSCSASLRDPLHRGRSDRYCRFCADDAGRLRPREDVRSLLAGWLSRWTTGLDEEEAGKRAEMYMSSMPAWSEN